MIEIDRRISSYLNVFGQGFPDSGSVLFAQSIRTRIN
jgi:hypothetical protein